MLDFESIIQIPTPLEKIEEDLFEDKGVEVYVKRDDLTHPLLSGNKFRKLKYNLLEAERQGIKRLLTFGGAYSNHLSAFAFACRTFGFRGEAVVRGEELHAGSSPTLAFVHSQGVKLTFVSREAYRSKQVHVEEGCFVIPEGGSNRLAVKGVAELVAEIGPADYLLTACGTGGTLAGLLAGASADTRVLGVSVLKNGGFLEEEVAKLLSRPFPQEAKLLPDYHFGGYARWTAHLAEFIRGFEAKHGIRLEQVYTGKMVYAFYDLLRRDFFRPGSRVVLLHTGGLQGRDTAL